MAKYIKTAMKYFERHVDFNGVTHLFLGIGVGALLAYPVFGSHPVRFGLLFLVLGIAGHVWAATHKP